MSTYIGRFAPSPTGKLHQGSLVALLASYLDARAHSGKWLVRIEDIDPPRDIPGAGDHILSIIGKLGLSSDEPVIWQHNRYDAYQAAFDKLVALNLVYPCTCSRKEIALAATHLGLAPNIYPGTCRCGASGSKQSAYRFKTTSNPVSFTDRILGTYTQNVEKQVGDFVIKRADGLWAYQLAVVVDDIYSGVTDVVRGADLIDNTPRQILLYRALGYKEPRYMHVALVLNDRGEKLSKQTKATPLDENALLSHLESAFSHLGFKPIGANNIESFYKEAIELWKERYCA